MFLSHIKFRNDLITRSVHESDFAYSLKPVKDRTNATLLLNKDFNLKQQAMIEATYEGWSVTISNAKHAGINDLDKCIAFRLRVKERHSKIKNNENIDFDDFILVAICENIIKNKGRFKP